MHQTSAASSAPPASSAEACLDTMSLLSLKDPVRTLHACQNVQPTTEGGELNVLLPLLLIFTSSLL